MSKKFKRPPRGFTEEAAKRRVEWIKQETGIDYSDMLIEHPDKLQGIIEQYIGYNPIPMAIASPLLLHGDYAQGEFMLPVCTLEGTLVYSLTRGMMATADSGGITTRHLGQRLSRAPVFCFSNIQEVKPFINFIDLHLEQIKQAAESSTKYGKLLDIRKTILGSMIILEFIYFTDNAAGQNMVTFATQEACKFIHQKYKHHNYDFFLESGLNCDKKLSRRTMSVGRGHSVIAEASLSTRVLSRLLHITTEQVCEFFRIGSLVSHVTGTVGLQLHIANALTAIYMAMGQDVACVAENALGNLEVHEGPDDTVRIVVTTPSLTIGTVGGGVRLPSQQRNLELVGCHEGKDSSKKLAEIITGSVLCLEVSLFAAIVSDTFANAHKTYGRNNV